MKKIIIIALFLSAFGQGHAQQLTPTAIGSFGRSSVNGGILLEDQLGSLCVKTISSSTSMYTQGFIQPDAGTTTGPIYINDVSLGGGGYGLDNAGTTFINGGIMLEFTTGEFASKTLNGSGNMLTQGVLQPFNTGGVLPITGLEFYAKRLNNSTVQLDWKTVQEINNKGFHIERKKENENNYIEVGYTASSAAGGNSSFPLSYSATDVNSFSGNSYYRLKQEDKDGKSIYSVIRIVKGDVNKQLAMQVWPIPSAGPVNVVVNGLTQPDVLMVYDISGRMVKQQAIQNNSQIKISNLIPGTYMLRLAENRDVVQKIIIQ